MKERLSSESWEAAWLAAVGASKHAKSFDHLNLLVLKITAFFEEYKKAKFRETGELRGTNRN